MKPLVLFIIAILVVGIAMIIGSSNDELVTINYLIAQTQMRISTFMVICMLIGFVLGIFTIVLKYFALRLKLINLKRQLAKSHKQEA